jgi:outer membrane protein
MKKVLLSALALLAFSFANAQEEEKGNKGFTKGDVFVSGAVNLSSAKTGDVKVSSFEIVPKLGYFVTPNIAFGASVGYKSDKFNGNAEATNTGLGLGAFGRYYFTPADKFSLFGQLAVGFGSEKYEDGGDIKASTFGVNAGLGLNYFVSSNFALQASWAGLGYNSHKFEDADDSYNTFGLNADLSNINLGLVYKF